MTTGIGTAPPPKDRSELLERVGKPKARIYSLVRTILDDLEAVAPWDGLYYPPIDSADFLSMEIALLGMIDDIPLRVAALTEDLAQASSGKVDSELVDNLEFYFQGIQVSVASELDKLKTKLDAMQQRVDALSAEDRSFTCEISADLKGKVTSSIMGAAASLIAEGLWNGIEIEPVLFPEKAEEFDRNEQLVEALSQVTEDIARFLELVPLVELVASWNAGLRVDQYALTPLYSLLGDLGKLMQVTSRRALYSGDYHQIQRREGQLATRINELMTLHNATWGRGAENAGSDPGEIFPAMVAKATEMAAILDVEMLKKIVGEGAVKDLFLVVTLEKEDRSGELDGARKKARRKRIPDPLHPLITLLYDEDLKTFLELLLGSVLKRASLTVKRETPGSIPQVAEEPATESSSVSGVIEVAGASEETAFSEGTGSSEVLPPVDLASIAHDRSVLEPPELLRSPGEPSEAAHLAPESAPPESVPPEGVPPEGVPPEGTPDTSRLEALGKLLSILQPLLSRSSSQRKSFELVRRLLAQKRTIPAGLLESMRPYLYEVMNQLIPLLRDDSHLGDMYLSYGSGLFEQCQVLCDPELSPEAGDVDVPATMERVLDLLNHLAIAARSSVERSQGSAAADKTGPVSV